MTKKIKGKTAIPPEAGLQSKPAAPRAGSTGQAGRALRRDHARGRPDQDATPRRRARRAGRSPEGRPWPTPVRDRRASPPARSTSVPQRPKPADGGRAAPRAEQYVRLRVRVREGRLSVIDSHLVDGPLGRPRTFGGSNAYELTLGRPPAPRRRPAGSRGAALVRQPGPQGAEGTARASLHRARCLRVHGAGAGGTR